MIRRVVIVNWRNPHLTAQSALNVHSQLTGDDELIIVDNGSGDGSEEFLRGQGLNVIQTGQNLGFGGAVNAGAAYQGYWDALVLVNNDAQVQPGFLNAITMPLHTPGVGASTAHVLLSGRWQRTATGEGLVDATGHGWRQMETGIELVNSTGTIVDSRGNGQDRDWLTPDRAHRASTTVFGMFGGACAISRDAWEQEGPFLTDLFMYYEDTEYSWRLREAGWSICYAPDARIIHQHSASTRSDSPNLTLWNTRNRLRVTTMHGPMTMVARAWLRTCARIVRGPRRVTVMKAIGEALGKLPTDLTTRRRRVGHVDPSHY